MIDRLDVKSDSLIISVSMPKTTLATIASLTENFTPNPIPIDGRFKLDEPFLHAFNILTTKGQEQTDAASGKAFRLFRESRRFYHTISTLVFYSIYFLTN